MKENRLTKTLPRIVLVVLLLLLLVAMVACGKHIAQAGDDTGTGGGLTSSTETDGGENSTCTEHDFDEGAVTREPTLTETGTKVYKCKNCGFEKEETLETLTIGFRITTVGFGKTDVPESGEYSLSDPYKIGYKFVKWVGPDGADFPTKGTISEDITVTPIFEVLPTYTADELSERAEGGAEVILLANDITIDRTVYFTGQTTVLAEGEVKLTRAKDFVGDMFVIGENSKGEYSVLDGGTARLILGASDGSTKITVDGNRASTTVDVVGSAFFLVNGAEVSMYDGITVSNHKKVGNQRLSLWLETLDSKSTSFGGAAVFIVHGTFNMYGGEISNNAVNVTDIGNAQDNTSYLSAYGGAIFNSGNFNMYGGTIKDNNANRGGAIFTRKRVNIYAGIIEGNTATNKGGAICATESALSEVYIGSEDANENTVLIKNNSATVQGGAYLGYYLSQFSVLGGTTFEGNRAEQAVGGAVSTSGAVIIKNAKFINNYAFEGGGAIYQYYIGEDTISHEILLENCSFEANEAGRGGAIVVSAATDELAASSYLKIVNCTFMGNKALKREINGVDETGAPTVKYSYGSGGAIYIAKQTRLDIIGGAFEQNTADEHAGAIFLSGDTLTTVTNGTVFESNSAKRYGGAIYASSAKGLTVSGATFVTNGKHGEYNTLRGGAIYNENIALITESCTFEENTAVEKGGAIYVATDGTYVDGSAESVSGGEISHFIKNSSEVGGAVCMYGKADFFGTEFKENSASENGGALYLGTGIVLNVNGATFNANEAKNGGAIASFGIIDISNTVFIANKAAERGGAIYTEANTIKITDSEFAENKANEHGGALSCNKSTVTVDDSRFYNNEAGKNGGAIYVNTPADKVTVTTRKCTFTSNKAVGNGGAVYVTSTGIYVDGEKGFANSGSIFGTAENGNTASNAGGAMFIYGTAELYGSALSHNAAIRGGAIYVGVSGTSPGKLTIEDSEFTYNGATVLKDNETNNGGAIYATGATLVINNTSFSHNEAKTNGGAIYLTKNETALVTPGCTFIQNVAAENGGAIYMSSTANYSVSGKLVITDNIAASKENNLYIENGADIKLVGTLDASSVIGITRQGSDTDPELEIIQLPTEENGYTLIVTGKCTYQWYKWNGSEWQKIDGETSAKLSNAVAGTSYMCVATCYGDTVCAYVSNESQSHPVCGNSCTHSGAHESIKWKPIFSADDLLAAAKNGGAYFLIADIELDTTLVITSDLKLCLNGKTVRYIGSTKVSLITVEASASFTLTDCSTEQTVGYIDPNTKLWVKGTYSGDGTVITVVLTGGMITGGNAGTNGVICVYGTLNMFGGNIVNNTAYHGGAIRLCEGSTADIKNVSFIANRATTQGGAIRIDAMAANIENCRFIGNRAAADTVTSDNNGGALYINSGTATIVDCLFEANYAGYRGGAIYATQTLKDHVIITKKCNFIRNSSENGGGAIYLTGTARYRDGAEGESVGSTFRENSSSNGGAIMVYGTASFYFTGFYANTATNAGGAVYLASSSSTSGNASFYGAILNENVAKNMGGAIYAVGVNTASTVLNVINTQMSENKVTVNDTSKYQYRGGAIATDAYVNAVIDGSTFKSNSGSSSGGAIGIYGASSNIEIKNSSFESNTAYNGGAIYAGGKATVTVSGITAKGNSARSSGAVIYLTSASTVLTLESAEVYDNNTANGIASSGFLHVANAANVLNIYKDNVSLISSDTCTQLTKDWSVMLKNPNKGTVNEKASPVEEA